MAWNDDLVSDVAEKLAWDPKVAAAAIAVSADDGTITLRGSVATLRQKREAQAVAERVFGVVAVHNELRVQPSNGGPPDARAEARRVSVKATKGKVTLIGTVGSPAERDEAIAAAWSLPGVTAVDDRITVSSDPRMKTITNRNAKGQEAPMVITPRAVWRLLKQTAQLLRPKDR